MSEKSGYVIRLGNPEDVRQLRLMLGLPEPRELPTFRELAEGWFVAVAARFENPSNETRNLRRLNEALGHLTEETLLPADIQRLLSSMTELGAISKNKIRSSGLRVVDWARLNGRWRSGNPFEPVKRFKEPRRAYDILTLEEARAVLRCVRADMRDLFTVALVMGDRKGELFGWRKEDLDLERRSAWIRRSHGRNTTKTGRPRQVPIPLAAIDALRRAVQSSPSELVFPREDGTRYRKDTKMTKHLRSAMGAAGLVLGYDARCPRPDCGFKKKLDAPLTIPCEQCGHVLRLVPRVRPIRFQDLRHTAAGLHREAGADPLCIKLLLGHASQDLTDDTYSHLSAEFQRQELDKLRL